MSDVLSKQQHDPSQSKGPSEDERPLLGLKISSQERNKPTGSVCGKKLIKESAHVAGKRQVRTQSQWMRMLISGGRSLLRAHVECAALSRDTARNMVMFDQMPGALSPTRLCLVPLTSRVGFSSSPCGSPKDEGPLTGCPGWS